MEMQDFRKQRLAALVEADGGPAAFARRSRPDADKPIDATHVSQIINGHRPFGERAARNMERRAGLARFYFDGTDRLNPIEAHLIHMFRVLPESFREALMSDAKKYIVLAKPPPDKPPGKADGGDHERHLAALNPAEILN